MLLRIRLVFQIYYFFNSLKIYCPHHSQAVLDVLKEEAIDKSGGKLGGRELLDLIIRKWGVAYDIQLRKNKVCVSPLEITFLFSKDD